MFRKKFIVLVFSCLSVFASIDSFADTTNTNNEDGAGKAAVAGAVTGGAVALGTVYATGTTGLAATGITSGLATLGGVVGGGMAAGVVLTAAAPVVGVYVALRQYKKWRHRKDN